METSAYLLIDYSRNTITYHNALCLSPQNFGVTNKEHYGMLWYFLVNSFRKQPDRVVRALDLQFGGPEFNSCSDR